MKHIPTRCFSDTIDIHQRIEIIENYQGEEWNYPKIFLSETKKITSSAIRIAEVIKQKFDIKLFPMVEKVACRGWDISGGTAAFRMYGENAKYYLFWDRARDYKSLKGEYSFDGEGFHRESFKEKLAKR